MITVVICSNKHSVEKLWLQAIYSREKPSSKFLAWSSWHTRCSKLCFSWISHHNLVGPNFPRRFSFERFYHDIRTLRAPSKRLDFFELVPKRKLGLLWKCPRKQFDFDPWIRIPEFPKFPWRGFAVGLSTVFRFFFLFNLISYSLLQGLIR